MTVGNSTVMDDRGQFDPRRSVSGTNGSVRWDRGAGMRGGEGVADCGFPAVVSGA